jgi:HEAT repeat protein
MAEKGEELVRQLRKSRSLSEILEVCAAAGSGLEVVHMLTKVLGSEEMSVRWKASVALTEMGTVAVDDLLHCLSDERSCVRSSAAWVLGNIGDTRAVPLLLGTLEDPSMDVRREVQEALGKLRAGPRDIQIRNGVTGA